MFAQHGIPDELIADNMPFDQCWDATVCITVDFMISTSSPEHPASNGQSEWMVGIVKQLMRKANQEDRDPHLALLEYRNTPISGLSYSPFPTADEQNNERQNAHISQPTYTKSSRKCLRYVEVAAAEAEAVLWSGNKTTVQTWGWGQCES